MKKTIESSRKYVNILGINVDSTSKDRVLMRVNKFLSHNSLKSNLKHKFYIVTPNPELVLMAQTSSKLKVALNGADIAIADGIGLSQAAKFLSFRVPENKILRFFVTLYQGLVVGSATLLNKKYLTDNLEVTKGRELFLDLIKYADNKKLKVFFLGGENGEARNAAKRLSENYKNVKIEYFQGPIVDTNAQPVSEVDIKLQEDVVDRINKFTPDFLFVAMKNPKQEIWIHENINKLNVGCAMTVGGTFRYISGMSKLPPKWMESLGLEWVWRLLTEPFRLGRILNAFPIFPIKVWMYKLLKN